ncbi:hypothetical protein [Thermus brockianus]|uniref:hypothetical protein n=1 Tax=Thermus brockianus TaxID=56956 RepID=UPI001FCCA2A0|nr:hypothetical protein [Thermus brockianus]
MRLKPEDPLATCRALQAQARRYVNVLLTQKPQEPPGFLLRQLHRNRLTGYTL